MEGNGLAGFLITGAIALGALLLGVILGVAIVKSRSSSLDGEEGNNRSKSAEKLRNAERIRLRAIYNLVITLASTLNYRRVLDDVLNLSAQLLAEPDNAPDRMVSAVLLFSRGVYRQAQLSIRSARRLTPSDMKVVLPAQEGLLNQLVVNPEPALLVKNVSEDPELCRLIGLRACNSVFGLPLRSGLKAYGVLLFAHPDPDYFTPQRCELLEIVSNQASIAIHNAQLYSDLEEEKNRMMEIQEDARKKLARDLHDGPTQSVSAIAMRVNFARRLMDRDQKAGIEELGKIEDMARRTTKEIRHMLFTLRPLVLESQGLDAALATMAEKMFETYGQKVQVTVDPCVVPELELNKQGVIFNIVEEAVNNARKHAQADLITVKLNLYEKDIALLEIADNGVGFNLEEVDALYEKRGSLGLVNMRERAELLNSHLMIDSAEGKGTQIRLLIPLTEDAAEKILNGR